MRATDGYHGAEKDQFRMAHHCHDLCTGVQVAGPTHGLIKVRTTTLNQHDEAVQVFVGNLLVPSRGNHPNVTD